MENKLNYSLMNSYCDACATLEAQIIESSLTEDQKKEMYSLIDKALNEAYYLGVDSVKK